MNDLKKFITTIIKFSFLLNLTTTPLVLSCGMLPSGQERNLRFTVSDIKLALPMVYTEDPTSRSSYPTVQGNAMQAQTFVGNLVMRAMNDVLEQQGRGAGLSDAVISLILDQLTLNVTFTPLNCFSVSDVTQAQPNPRMNDKNNCLVVGDTVTTICVRMDMAECGMVMHLRAISQENLTITGNLKIGNLIMASWSDQMWRTILSRALQVLSSGPFATSFQAASFNLA